MKEENPFCISVYKTDICLSFQCCMSDLVARREWKLGQLNQIANALRELVLSTGFLDRPATLICWDTSHCSQPEFDQGRVLATDSSVFKAVSLDVCAHDLLSRLASAWDFEIGLVWVLGVSAVSETSLIDSVNSLAGTTINSDGTEMIEAKDDGRTILWWNPSVSTTSVIDLVKRFAESADCHLKILKDDESHNGILQDGST